MSSTTPHATNGASRATTTEAEAIAVVERFIEALERLDIEGAAALCTDDVVYQNVPLPPTRTRAGLVRTLKSFFPPIGSPSFEVRMHNIAANGSTVLTERTDVLGIGAFKASFWVCGTFEVRDGRIALWRDRFDFADVLVGFGRGAVGAAWTGVRGLLARR